MSKWLLVFLLFPSLVFAQSEEKHTLANQLVGEFFEAFHAGDTVKLKALMLPNALVQTWDPQGNRLRTEPMRNLLLGVAGIKALQAEEKWSVEEILNAPDWLEAAGPYSFYLQGTIHHSGWNQFTFVRTGDEWKIARIMDSRIRS